MEDKDFEIEQESLDMNKLALSNATKYLATYKNPKEWILDEKEAKAARVFKSVAPEKSSKVGSLAYSAGELLRTTYAAPRQFIGSIDLLSSALKDKFYPNAEESALERWANNYGKLEAQREQVSQELVSQEVGDQDWYVVGSAASQLIRDIALTGGMAKLGAKIAAKTAEKKVAGKLVGEDVAQRYVSQMAGKGAQKAGGATITGSVFAQEVGSRTVDDVNQYIAKTGDADLKYYDPSVDLAVNIGVGALSAQIEKGLGVERFVPRLIARGAGEKIPGLTQILARGAEGMIGESLEEGAQETAAQIGEMIKGYREWWDVDTDQILTSMTIGGVLGGTAGAGLYYINRRTAINRLVNEGMDKNLAADLVDTIASNEINKTINNLSASTELNARNGQAYDKLKAGIKSALELQGWSEKMIDPKTGAELSLDEYVDLTVNSQLIHTAVREAITSGITIDEFLDVAQFTAVDNFMVLRPLGTAEEIKSRIDEQKAIIARQQDLKKTGAGSDTVLREAKMKKAILEKVRTNKIINDEIQRVNVEEAKTPENVQEIDTAKQDVEALNNAPTAREFNAGLDANLTTAQKTKRLGNAVLKKIFGRDNLGFDSVITLPQYANAKTALTNSAERIINFAKKHRTYGIQSDLRNALKLMQTVNQGNFLEHATTPSLDGTDVIAQNAFLYHFLFKDADTTTAFIDAYLERAEASISGETDTKLTKKDLVGQAFKATDNLMQVQAESAGIEYDSIFNEDGSYKDQNVAAVMMSYQNQFAEERRIPTQQEQEVAWKKAEEITQKVLENISKEEKALAKKTGAIKIQGKNGTIYSPVKSEGDVFIELIPQIDDITGKWVLKYQTYARETRPSSMFGAYGGEFTKGSSGFGRSISLDTKENVKSAIKQIIDIYGKDNVFFSPEYTDKQFNSYVEKYKRPAELDYKNQEIRDLVNQLFAQQEQQVLLQPEQFDLADETNYDGVIAKNIKDYAVSDTASWEAMRTVANDYIALDPTQIKSVDNRGTFSEKTGNIYYQSAYAGSRVDYDKPSLEAIGSGEGAAAHGWGLYYALNPDIAERYREMFTGDTALKYDEEKLNDLYTSLERSGEYEKASLLESILVRHDERDMNDLRAEGIISQKTVDWFNKIKSKYLNKERKLGQVHEVDIPEMDVLLDEQKMLIDQSQYVQDIIQKINKDLDLGIVDSGIRGGAIYQKIADKMDEFILDENGNVADYNNPFKQASELLDKYGIKGITYDGRQDGRCFVIFNPESVKVLRKKFDELGNVLFQGKKANGFFDPELNVVLLGKNWNTMTLPHELAHYWLNTLFNVYKRVQSGELKANAEWVQEKKDMFAMLGIDENQDALTTGQQEKFARMTEAYLTGIGVSKEMNQTFKDFFAWVPEKYKSILQLGYLDDQGKLQYPFLDQKAVDFFNRWYENASLPSLPTSPERQRFMNVTDSDGEVEKVSIKEMNDREKEFAQDAEEQQRTDARLYNTLDENMPADIKPVADAQKVVIDERSNFLKEAQTQQAQVAEEPKRRWFERKSRETETQKAQEYIEKNPEHAKEVIFGDPELIPNDTGVDRATLINTYMALNNITPESPDWATLHTNIAINQSLAGTQLALSNDKSYGTYLDALREVENALELKAATNYAGSKNGARERFNADIQKFLDKELPAIFATEPNSKEREVALQAMFEKARTTFSGNTIGSFLNQVDLDYAKGQTKKTEAFMRWAINQIKKDAGAKLNNEQQAKLLQISAKAQQAMEDLDNRDAGKAVAAAQELRKWQMEKQALMGVSPQKFSLFGDYAPRAMLASFNTLVVANVPSTAINTVVVNATKTGLFGKNAVSKDLIDSEVKRIKAIYGATGMNLAQMEKPTSPSLLHGEKYSASGQKWYDPYTILGKEDNFFRVPTFVNTLAQIASTDAKATGRSADDVFREYASINNQSDEAKLARKQALAVANMAVFTQNGALASCLNHIRSELNKLSRVTLGLDPQGFGLGNLIAPFLTTGANIAEMGIRGSLAPITTITTMVNKWRTGKALDPMKALALRMDWTYFTLSAVSMVLLAALTSDDDDFYTDPYRTGIKYSPDKPYDSINLGGVWLDLDFFGAFSIPMRTAAKVIQAWKKDNGIGTAVMKGYAESAKSVLGDVPLAESIINNQVNWAVRKPGSWASSYLYTQANKLVPAQIKPISRALSRGEEWMFEPFAGTTVGRKFNRNYGFDGAELTSQDLIELFTIKVQLDESLNQKL